MKAFANIAFSAALCVSYTAAFAQEKAAGTPANASQLVLKLLQQTYPNTPFTAVRPSPIVGIFEITMQNNIAYSDATGRFFFFGNVMDMQTQKNLTEERRAEITKVNFEDFKIADAIRTVRGNGRRVLYVFSDPECGYCKQLEPALSQLNDITIYTFLYPILGQKSHDMAKSIWCAPDRSKAWAGYMLEGSAPARGKPECLTPVDRNVELGKKMRINGTPTMFTADGKQIAGAIPTAEIEKAMADSSQVKKYAQPNIEQSKPVSN